MARTKKQTHRTAQKHAEHQDATDIQKKLFCVCFSETETRFFFSRTQCSLFAGNDCYYKLCFVWYSVLIHSNADPGIASSIPLTSNKFSKRRYVLVSSQENASVYQCFTLGTLKLYMPRRRMGRASECVAKQKQYPHSDVCCHICLM